MRPGRPSVTALGVAAIRAAHQRLEGGRVFHDPLAARILGADADDPAFETSFDPARRVVRLVVAARSRFAEDALATAVERGVRQVVVLGAGLDTFAYRSPHDGLRVFEVDVPSTQEWKRARLADAGIAVPPSVTFAPVDVERTRLADGLGRTAFDMDRPAFFSCMGVVPYLTPETVFGILGFVATLPAGSAAVFDYGEPPDALPPDQRADYDARAAWAAANGEPFRCSFSPEDLLSRVRDLGFRVTANIDYVQLVTRYESGAELPGESTANHVLHIERPAG
jgi:methyltransferase (TIGR00027 family)